MDILCLQETHYNTIPPTIPGMHLVVHNPRSVYGSAMYVKNPAIIERSFNDPDQRVEVLRAETTKMRVISVYKPPPTSFIWPKQIPLDTPHATKPTVIIGDFNSHNTIWGYDENNTDGEAVEELATTKDLTLLHNLKDGSSFMSVRWKKDYNLVFVSSSNFTCFEKTIADPILNLNRGR